MSCSMYQCISQVAPQNGVIIVLVCDVSVICNEKLENETLDARAALVSCIKYEC